MDVSHVLLLVPELRNPEFHGGIQVFNNFLLRALQQLEIQTTVIGLNDRQQDRVPGLIPCRRPRRLAKFNLVRHALWRSVRDRPQLVICGHRNFAPAIAPICRLTRTPMLTITHGIELWDASPTQIRALATSRAILAVSRYTRGLNVEQLPGYPPEQIKVFHNTFNENRFVPGTPDPAVLDRLGLTGEEWIVLTVGRLTSSDRLKGYEEGIRAMAEVVRRHPEARYVLAGRGDDLDYLRGVGDEAGLGDRLIMPGFVSEKDLQSLFNACRLFILPSRKEGFGIVFLEAMGCGKPVIGGNRDGSMDPLCDGTLGTAVDPTVHEELVAAILDHREGRIASSKTDPHHLRREVISRFGNDQFRNRLQTILAEL